MSAELKSRATLSFFFHFGTFRLSWRHTGTGPQKLFRPRFFDEYICPTELGRCYLDSATHFRVLRSS